MIMLTRTHRRLMAEQAAVHAEQAEGLRRSRKEMEEGHRFEVERLKNEVKAVKASLSIAQGECASLRGQLVAARHAAGLPAADPQERTDDDKGGRHRDNGDGSAGGSHRDRLGRFARRTDQ